MFVEWLDTVVDQKVIHKMALLFVHLRFKGEADSDKALDTHVQTNDRYYFGSKIREAIFLKNG